MSKKPTRQSKTALPQTNEPIQIEQPPQALQTTVTPTTTKPATSTPTINEQPPPPIALIDTNIEPAAKDDIAAFCRMFRAKPYVNPSPNVTHCVTSTVLYENEHYATKRTVKLIMAFSERTLLLSAEWLTACLCAEQLVDPSPYTVRGIILGNKTVRFKAIEANAGIFIGQRFYIESRDAEAITHRKVSRLVENCGGTICEPGKDVLIVVMGNRAVENMRGVQVTFRYVLDCLTFQTRLKLDNYTIE